MDFQSRMFERNAPIRLSLKSAYGCAKTCSAHGIICAAPQRAVDAPPFARGAFVKPGVGKCDWPRSDSNRYGDYSPGDFKSPVSAIPPRGRVNRLSYYASVAW